MKQLFKLKSSFKPTGDQPEAIEKLTDNLLRGVKEQVLLGVTGSGKTFTMANAITKLNRPTLVISHNKTLAAQLYQEFKEFFPENSVNYFVSYYDYYQPEAYIPQSDTYIEKETEINEEIDKMRLAATANLLTRPDTIIVASVSCIYNIGSPREYGNFVLELQTGMILSRESILTRLVQLQYERNEFGFSRSSFRVRGDSIDLYPAYLDTGIRITLAKDQISSITEINPLTGSESNPKNSVLIYPAKHYMTDPRKYKDVFSQIQSDTEKQFNYFKRQNKFIEAQRIHERVNHDLEMIQALGYVNGIENYSRYFDGRNPGDPPYSLLDYYEDAANNFGKTSDPNSWLLFIDESHMTLPQIRGMYNGDRSRKQTLIDYGFRLPAALDNRPLKFEEFMRKIPQTVYVSATPNSWELDRATEAGNRLTPKASGIVEQLVRPTGLLDPTVQIRPSSGQIEDLVKEIDIRAKRGERVLVTTLTKQTAEDLSNYLIAKKVKVNYLHSEILTLDRSEILADLRSGKYDCIVGVNLLREGLDLPEVALVAILDADKEGFLRSKTSLIQTMGRAARHITGEVILYADQITDSIRYAVSEVTRRRSAQIIYNTKHNLTPRGIQKPIRAALFEKKPAGDYTDIKVEKLLNLKQSEIDALTPMDKLKLIKNLTKKMREYGRNLDFETAARIRDLITHLES